MISNILFAVVSVVLCVIAPGKYDYNFCLTVMVLFLVQNILYFCLNRRKSNVGFVLFFFISYLFCNFIYPVVYYPVRPGVSFFSLYFNTDVISRSTAIAYMGYAFFLLGCTSFFRMNREEPTPAVFKFGMNEFLWFFLVTAGAFVLYIASGGYHALHDVYANHENLRAVGIYSYFNNIFTIACYLMGIFVFRLPRQKWWFYLLVLGTCILIILSTGSRSLTLGMVLVLLVSFNNNVRRFKPIEIAAVVAVGVIGLYIVMMTRKHGMSIEKTEYALTHMRVREVTDLFLDLIINNRNLYVLVDYADQHGLTWLHGMLVDLTSPIPGMAGWLTQHFGEPIELLHGGDLPSYITLGPNAGWGLGTNMTGEAFRSFGYTGTAVSMFLIGLIVKESYYHARTNIYAYTLYYLFVSHAVMYPRAPLLFDPRTVVWGLLLVWFVTDVRTWRLPRRTDSGGAQSEQAPDSEQPNEEIPA
ncbi:MAG: O-antigen polysaccharide polymerase Wzy [Paludibacteraceae bacterium]|nr:O-antigen polysaccharide polymerase Wzy [Paludibacteraceae bacterium]